jgi:cysteine synthase A
MVNPDRGDRYLETVYNPERLSHNGFAIVQGEDLERSIMDLKSIKFGEHGSPL